MDLLRQLSLINCVTKKPDSIEPENNKVLLDVDEDEDDKNSVLSHETTNQMLS